MSHGIGSESQRPLAIVIIGGLIGATFLLCLSFLLLWKWYMNECYYDKTEVIVKDVFSFISYSVEKTFIDLNL